MLSNANRKRAMSPASANSPIAMNRLGGQPRERTMVLSGGMGRGAWEG